MTLRHRRYAIVSDCHAPQTRSSNLNQRHLITLLPGDLIDLDQPAGWLVSMHLGKAKRRDRRPTYPLATSRIM